MKRISRVVDDDADLTTTFKAVIEESNNYNDVNRRIEVHTSNNPVVALSEFKPNFYDLLLVDINMPEMNRFELSEKILAIDINVKVCYMSSAEALREIYPALSIGWFIVFEFINTSSASMMASIHSTSSGETNWQRKMPK